MNDQLIRDLLHEAADDIEPRDRLDVIRAATAPAGRRTHRGWWAAGGAGLLAASVATAFALTTGGAPQSGEPDVADPAPTSAVRGGGEVVPIYFVGDAAAGPRLYREFQTDSGPAGPQSFAMDAALTGTALDPDYLSLWPRSASVTAFSLNDDFSRITLTGDVHDRPDGMGDAEARLAIEQLIRTAQGAFGHGRMPVKLLIDGEPTDQVLGVPAADPFEVLPDAEVLAPVSLSDPSERQEVDNDEPFTVKGRGTSADGQVQVVIKRWEGTGVVRDDAPTVSTDPDRLTGFEVAVDLSDVGPGDYDVIATVQNADGTHDSDTRRITVVD